MNNAQWLYLFLWCMNFVIKDISSQGTDMFANIVHEQLCSKFKFQKSKIFHILRIFQRHYPEIQSSSMRFQQNLCSLPYLRGNANTDVAKLVCFMTSLGQSSDVTHHPNILLAPIFFTIPKWYQMHQKQYFRTKYFTESILNLSIFCVSFNVIVQKYTAAQLKPNLTYSSIT